MCTICASALPVDVTRSLFATATEKFRRSRSRRPSRCAMPTSMKLWDDPVSRRATATASPTETKTFIVWKLLARTPVMACSEIPGSSSPRVSVEHSISSSTSSSSSVSPTSSTKSFLQQWPWTYFSSQLKHRPSACRCVISACESLRRGSEEVTTTALLDPDGAEAAEEAACVALVTAGAEDDWADVRALRPGGWSVGCSCRRCS
jgi:hypothetical protein